MNRIDLTGSLAFGTIGIVLLLLVVLLLRFLRKPQNRHPLPDGETVNVAKRLDEASVDAAAGSPEIR